MEDTRTIIWRVVIALAIFLYLFCNHKAFWVTEFYFISAMLEWDALPRTKKQKKRSRLREWGSRFFNDYNYGMLTLDRGKRTYKYPHLFLKDVFCLPHSIAADRFLSSTWMCVAVAFVFYDFLLWCTEDWVLLVVCLVVFVAPIPFRYRITAWRKKCEEDYEEKLKKTDSEAQTNLQDRFKD